MTTPQVVRGESIRVILYDPDTAWGDPGEPGQFSGWSFLQAIELPESPDLYFFDQVQLDSHARDVVDQAVPGTYLRDSQSTMFTREQDRGGPARGCGGPSPVH